MPKDEHYVTIQGWMQNKLELKGNELIIYAIIYGFSQDDESLFTGSAGYLAGWCGSSRSTIMDNLKSLTAKGFIEKTDIVKNGIKLCNYKAINPVRKSDIPCPEIGHTPCPEIGHHIISSNNKDNIKEMKVKKEEDQFLIFYQSYPKKSDKTDAKKVFSALIKKGTTLETILSKLKIYQAKLDFDKTEAKFIRGPARFLRTLDDFEAENTFFKPIQSPGTFVTTECPKCHIKLDKYNNCPECGVEYDLMGRTI
jgi:hypothetical protein